MTFTLAGRSLYVQSFEEGLEAVDFQWDTFENEVYKRDMYVYGKVKTWTLECLEDIAWANSAAKEYQEKLEAGTSVSLVVSQGTLHSVTATVKFLAVDISYEDVIANKIIRKYTVKLQQV